MFGFDGNIFAIIVANDNNFGNVAIAEKIPTNSNLMSIIQKYNVKSINVCKTWKHAKELEKYWNESFIANGSQKKQRRFKK